MASRSTQHAAHELWRAAGSTALSNMTYNPSKLGQIGLVFWFVMKIYEWVCV